MAYESLQAILEEAGMSHQELAETPYGAADGTNKAFTTQHKPLSDLNHDDEVTADDILVLVNGSPAAVDEIDALRGVITLVDAPAEDATIIIDYRYSSAPLSTVAQRRREAEKLVNDTMKGVDPCAPYTQSYNAEDESQQIDDTVRSMVRIYAAGMLLTRDYGYSQDTELTSKDGFYKMRLVTGSKNEPGMLARFKATGGVCGGDSESIDSGGLGGFQADSSGDLFGDFPDRRRPNSDGSW